LRRRGGVLLAPYLGRGSGDAFLRGGVILAFISCSASTFLWRLASAALLVSPDVIEEKELFESFSNGLPMNEVKPPVWRYEIDLLICEKSPPPLSEPLVDFTASGFVGEWRLSPIEKDLLKRAPKELSPLPPVSFRAGRDASIASVELCCPFS
jgi:hypothetical protein